MLLLPLTQDAHGAETCWDFAFPDFTVPGGVWASWGPWLAGARWKKSVT